MSRLIVVFLIIALPALASDDDTAACTALTARNFATIPDAPATLSSANVADEPVPHCRVVGTIAPAVTFELRLPLDDWNGKLMMQGCRAYCGVVMIDDANDALARGYATVATDMGHSGTVLDTVWAYNNRPAEIDYGYRATHVTALAAKAVVDAFTGSLPERSYFRGCSTGGRQGLVEAYRFPADFDGIIAGSPVVPGDGVLNFYWTATANLRADGTQILTPGDLPVLRAAVMKQCDALDGLADGVLEDPRQCDFDPATAGLSPEKAEAARKIYQGPVTASGRRLTPGGQEPGSELNWLDLIVSRDGGPGYFLSFAENYLRYLAFDTDPGPDYTIGQFDMARDADRFGVMLQISDPFNPDLRDFRARGGRLILYHGWQDDLMPAGTVDYYETLAGASGGMDDARTFARLFMIPGMNHCGGGPGPTRFDFLSALEAWVEADAAPDMLMGRHVKANGDVDYARPVFAYPNTARYTGRESQIDAAAFIEVTPQ